MSPKNRFIRTKDGLTVATARPTVSGASKPLIYTAEQVWEYESGEYTGFPSVTVEIPYDAPQTLLLRGYIEAASEFSNTAGKLYFKPFNEYSPGATTRPLITFTSTIFTSKSTTLSGVHSVDPNLNTPPYQATLAADAFDYVNPADEAGWLYVYMKLIVIVGDYTGSESLEQ